MQNNPTPAQELQAIATLCRREGIMPSSLNPTITGQVSSLVQRTQALEQTITRLRVEADDSRQSCYAYSLELTQALAALASSDAEADTGDAAATG